MPYKDPEKRRASNREAQRRRRARAKGDTRSARTRKPLPELEALRYGTARAILGLLNRQIEAVEGEKEAGTIEKARAIGYLSSLMLRVIETGDLTDRIEALEKEAAAVRDTTEGLRAGELGGRAA